MTPLPNEPEGSPRYLYNQELCSARNCVERLFGVMKSVWRCLSRHRVLQYEPGMSGKIVNACAVLHNMRIANRLEQNICEEDDENIADIDMNNYNDDDDDDDDDNNDFRPLALARRIQERLIRKRFTV